MELVDPDFLQKIVITKYVNLQVRENSFKNTKCAYAAKYGYYRVLSKLYPNSVMVNCAFCSVNLDLSEWTKVEKDTRDFHKATSPNCKFEILVNLIHWDSCKAMTRVGTFATWPISLAQKPIAMASAGFFYTGQGDVVICYFCGITLNEWLPHHDPWQRHLESSAKCKHIEVVNRPYPMKMRAKFAGKKNVTSLIEARIREMSLQSELEPKGQDAIYCKICFTRTLNVLLIPCKHVYSCEVCFTKLKFCPLCRVQPENVMTIYFA